jgi:hypothetical protein
VNNRLVPNAIEPRSANASYSRAEDGYTLYVASQNPHVERLLMTAFVLGLPENKVRVSRPTWAAASARRSTSTRGRGRHLGLEAAQPAGEVDLRPQRAFVSDAHGRDHVTVAELALDKNGKFLAMRVQTTANLGAYLSTSPRASRRSSTRRCSRASTPRRHLLRGHRGVHQHHAGGRLPRRRPAEATYVSSGWSKPRRASSSSIRSRSGGATSSRLPLSDAGRAVLRHGQLRGDARARRSTRGRRGLQKRKKSR